MSGLIGHVHIKQSITIKIYVGRVLMAEIESKELGLFIMAEIAKREAACAEKENAERREELRKAQG